MTEPVRAAFRDQSRHCEALGSPFMARLCSLFAERLAGGHPVADRILTWDGDVGARAQSVPLRVCGALHAVSAENRAELARAYPPNVVSDDDLWASVDAALHSEAAFIDRFLDSPPQTNEVRRAATLIAAASWLGDRFDLPLRLSELGASAGLNLNFARFSLTAGGTTYGTEGSAVDLRPDWTGDLPPRSAIRVHEARAVDLSPIDATNAADRRRLLAYLWPDQPHRHRLTTAAMQMVTAPPDRADGVDWLQTRLAEAAPAGSVHMVYSTIAWQYFPHEARARGTRMIEAAGNAATSDSPLAWFTMEADDKSPGAALTLRLWPGDLRLDFGRADFHGRWVDWRNGEVTSA